MQPQAFPTFASCLGVLHLLGYLDRPAKALFSLMFGALTAGSLQSVRISLQKTFAGQDSLLTSQLQPATER